MALHKNNENETENNTLSKYYEHSRIYNKSNYIKSNITNIQEYGKCVEKHLKLSVLSFVFSFFFFGAIVAKKNLSKLSQLQPPFVDPTNFFEVSLLREIEKKEFSLKKYHSSALYLALLLYS